MKTECETINRTVYVYAQAKSKYQLESLEPGELPFDYIVKGYDYGDESCVRITEVPVAITIPAGIDITVECIKNLQEKIDAVRKQAEKDIKELEERIRNLALIEYRPGTDDDGADIASFEEHELRAGGTEAFDDDIPF